ncbi:MFS transporter [Streptomyces sp. NPDC002076]
MEARSCPSCSSASDADWAATSAVLAAAVATPVTGRLGDMYGKRLMLLTSLLMLVAGLMTAALSDGLGPVIVGRALQGLAPLGDARVTLLDAAGDVVATTTTGDDGAYAFSDLDGGPYTFIVAGCPSAPGRRGDSRRSGCREPRRPTGTSVGLVGLELAHNDQPSTPMAADRPGYRAATRSGHDKSPVHIPPSHSLSAAGVVFCRQGEDPLTVGCECVR